MLLYTESKKYPYVKFTSNQFNISSSLDAEVILSGELEFHGVTKNISINVVLSSKGDMLLGTTEFLLSLEEYGVDRPELLFIPISDKIIFGATIDLFDENSNSEITFKIVGVDETNVEKGLISVSSPVARSLMGKSVGDIAEVNTPGGKTVYEILKIEYK